MSRSTITSRPWQETPHDSAAANSLATALGTPPAVAALLWQRGVREIDDARAFLRPSLLDLHPPAVIPDLERAVETILAAGERGAPICIYGDYDVDGVSGTAILVEALGHLGIEARSYIPHRIDEGYGLNCDAIRHLRASGVELLITVDGGANDREEHALARELGLEIIVTDHHPIEGALPDLTLVHPGRPDASGVSARLCGAGVAYKLAWGLGQAAAGGEKVEPRYRSFLEEALALAALGTVADVVPLLGENRAIVAHGLRAIARSERPGLCALLEVCRIEPSQIEASDIGFRLAPHLNAAGRMGEVELALEILLTRDSGRGRQLATTLAGLNRQRKGVERAMFDDCVEEIEAGSHPPGHGPLLFAREGWHAGVAGIVASRLVEKLERPVFVVALDTVIGRGSARSLAERPLTALYDRLRGEVRSIGGHAFAGGVTLEPGQIAGFRSAIEGCAEIVGDEPLPPREYDLAVDGSSATLGLARGIAALAPFGAGNPEPILRIDGLTLEGSPRLVGKFEEHLQVRLRHPGGILDGIWFRGAARAGEFSRARGPISVIGVITEDRYRGVVRVRLRIVDVAP